MNPTLTSATTHPTRRRWARGWTLERALFAFGGSMVGLSAALAALVSPWFLLLTAFVAVNQLLFAAVGDCGASLLLRRFAHLSAANDG